jgi:periplasmic protein TonB
MSPKKEYTENFDEIVFEKRFKDYGAYRLRKIYKKHMNIAMAISFTLLLIGVGVPLIAGYMNKAKTINVDKDVVVDLGPAPTKEDAPPPPPPPPPPEALEQRVRFTAPVVVNDTVEENTSLNQDDLSNKTTNIAPVEEELTVVEEEVKPEIVEVKPPPFIVVEEMPSYPGGDDERVKFIQANISYPVMAKESNTQGTVYVTFVVENDGSITDVKVLRGIGGGCDEEAIRVVKMMPKWNAGKQSGKSVRVQFNLPIKFTLN